MAFNDKLDMLLRKYDELRDTLSRPDGLESREFARLSKEYAELSPSVESIMTLRSAESEAARLSFVLQQYRPLSANDAGLTVVAEDALSDDVRDLLADQGIGAVGLSAIDGYAESIKAELGL